MLGFWIIAATAAIVAIAFIGRALLTGTGPAEATAEYDLQVYRDQLKELDRDVARGVIEGAEAERARVEISRRLLEADRKATAGAAEARAPRGATLTALGLVAVVVLGGGLGLYRMKGAIVEDPEDTRFGLPSVYPDLPLASRIANAEALRRARPGQAEIEARLPAWPGPPADAPADYLELIDKLRATLADNPASLEGQELLAQHEAALGNFPAAHVAMAKALELKGAEATAEDFSRYADLLVLAAGGLVSPEAEAALERALNLDPNDPIALYYSGLMFAQNDRADVAFRIWRGLLEASDPGAPWVGPIRSQIGQLAAIAGVDYTPPAVGPVAGPALAGPSAEDMVAAEDMDPAARDEMVRGMVDRLMDRLATEGGSAAEWAQLIGALGVLGDTARAEAIWGEARVTFADGPDDLAAIDGAARQAGLDVPAEFEPAEGGDSGDGAVAGPSQADIAAAAEMSDADRTQMIEGMVSGLSDELATDGGPPEKWIMLLRSLEALGQTDQAKVVWGEAQKFFDGDPDGLARVRAVAEAIGVEP